MSRPTFSCFVIGSDTLLTECTGHLADQGHDVRGVITDTPRIATWARDRGLAVVAPEAMLDVLASDPFDHLFAITWLRLLPDALLDLPRGMAINFHDGPLPARAGLNVPAWGLMDGATDWAVTWHEITTGIDTGGILLETPVPVADDDTSLSLNMKCFAAARDGFPTLVAELAAGTLVARPQPAGERRIHYRSDRPDRAGLLDWRRPARELANRVRALDFGPYANPLGRAKLLDGARRGWIVVGARAYEGDSGEGAPEPGTVIARDETGWTIATGAGRLHITALSTLTGTPVEPGAAEARALPALVPGDSLPLPDPDEVEALDSAVAAAARHEDRTQRRLAALEAPGFPAVGAGDTEAADAMRTADVAVPENPALDEARFEATVVAAWVILLARWGRRSPFDLAWFDADATTSPLEAALFSPWRPLRVTPEPGGDFEGVIRLAAARLAEERDDGAFLTDLVSRRPELTDGSGSVTPRVPVAVRTGSGANTPAPTSEGRPPLTLVVDPRAAHLALEFDPGRIDLATARTLAEGLSTLLRRGLDAPSTPWQAVPAVDGAERRSLLDLDDHTATPLDESLVHERFDALARREPDRVAVRFEDRTLTYGELDSRAETLADRLRAGGVGPGRVVGVYVQRSPELLVATLAILKAGGAYLPLDPDFPQERIRFMLDDAGVERVVTAGPAPAFLSAGSRAVVDCLEESADGGRTPELRHPVREVGPDDLAYVIYTSGSTGRPKGVLVEHGNVANFFTGMDAVIDHDPPGVWMAVTSLSFDISVLELFWTLARGFEVVIYRDRERAAGTSGAGAVGRGTGPRGDSHAVDDRRLRDRGMQFGLFMWGNDDGPGPDKYRLMLDAGRYFDRNGFDSVWTPERHFHAFGGPFPNPSVTGAALAAVTERVSIRSGSVVSPLHHPIRIAEEWAVVDNLSAGRVGLAFAAGWQPNDFVLRPETYGDQKRVMVDEIDVIRRLWRGEAVSFTNPLGDAVEVTSLPRPVQPELPFWITTAGNPDTYRMAGRMGANVLTHLLGQSLEEVAEKIAAYRDARREAGLDPEGGTVTLMLHTFVGDDDDAVRTLVREPMKDYLRASMKLVLGFAWTFPAFKRPGGPDSTPDDIDLGSLTDEESEAILDFAFDRYYETSGLFGTPDTCVDIVARCAAIGVDEIACLLDFGVDTSDVLAGLPLLKEVRDRSNAVFEGRNESASADAATSADVATPTSTGDPVATAAPDPWGFARQLRERGVTHLQCTPSMARLLLEQPDVEPALAEVGHLMVGGEAFPESLSSALRAAGGGRVTNMYGPTETTIWSTTHDVDADGAVPIGRPIANTRIYVLDSGGEPVPAGVPGDLWIGGRGVVRGYHERDELTADRFRADPFAPNDQTSGGRAPRMYRTGDLARQRPDGVLEFLGRVDDQVKVRGHRIEPGEIEAALERMATVTHATVVLREDVPGDQRLVAYVVAQEPFDADAVRRALGEELPSYMVPGHLVPLDAMPLTPNGKVDRGALPSPDSGAARTQPAVAPANALEASLVEAWQRVLGVDVIGTTDNFFDAGGHSLLVVQLHRLLGERIAQPISLIDLYRFPTIASLAEHLSPTGTDSPALDASAERGARRREMMRRRRGG